jgi:hypothetical protein
MATVHVSDLAEDYYATTLRTLETIPRGDESLLQLKSCERG